MKSMDIAEIDGFEIAVVHGNPYLFTNMRIDRDSVPDGLYAYDVRDDDDCGGNFAEIRKFVMVNHWGTIIGAEKIPLDESWGSYFPDENDGYYNGEYMTLQEYMQEHKIPYVDYFVAECEEVP